ncbi:uracil-DNA glycosylase family protein [Woodsholea maritima]|uniref:uracil-DNA glycosylase family protein n=1 Tax=Woodsholea maritima TaxID=240237 RepID=UPI0003736CC6|nr:uracil-DNA glycosylase family protein [Woodsholea maritima]
MDLDPKTVQTPDFEALKAEIRACRVCEPALAHPVRPVVRGNATARIRIIGQAPGTRVQASGIPFDDPSGDRLRAWMGVERETFYDEDLIAITPMGFCFPGLDAKGGDLPPRKECAPLWQTRSTQALPHVRLTLLIGQYAQRFYLKKAVAKTLTQTVLQWRNYAPDTFVLPHPSWRNNAWIKKNPWFSEELLPHLRLRICNIIQYKG